ncbi:X2-like carbohydrate binding domain-containing protein [Paenibacillus sp. KS-LC4]|uniref:X2-like carbohydrate binding domain-containing protein n=1 Tax=Paenibacillus sp. KS-LC4 TaxID=2979727 RepID=UPI0030CE16CE
MTKRHYTSKWPRIGIFMLALLLMIQVCIPSIYAATTPDTFTTKSLEALPANSMAAGAYGNGVYVAVGTYGAIIKSTDADHWESVKTRADSNYTGVSAPASFSFYGVAYGNGVFVAVGTDGVILSSTDGVNWTQQASGVSSTITNVEYFTFNGAGAFYGLSLGKFVTSTNGTTWTTVVPTGLPSNKSITQVTVGENGTRLAVSSQEGKIYSTTNGTTWTSVRPMTPASTPADGANFMEWMNDRYFMIDISGHIWTSTNLSTFTLLGAPSKQDGVNATGQMRQGFYDGTHYYLFGSEGSKYGAVYTSTDATTWTQQPFEREFVDQNASYINGKYFLFGSEGISVSDTGSNWSYKWGGTFNEIIYDGTQYIAVGILGREGGIWTSNDLSAWTQQSVSGFADAFTAVAHGNGKYVAVAGPYHGATMLATSSNGTSWSLQAGLLGNETLTDVAYGNGVFVTAGQLSSANRAVIETSSDGVTWTERTLPTNTLNYLASVAYINNQFVALGNANDNSGNVTEIAILTSTDGINWTNHDSSYPNSTDFVTNIIFDGSKYILLGFDSSTYEMFTRTSADLATWSAPGLTGGYFVYGGSTFMEKKGNTLYGLFTDSSYESEDIFYSNDDGATWQASSTLDSSKRAAALMNLNNEVVVSGPNKLVMMTGVSASSAISPGSASFDKETSAQSDVAVTLTLNGNTLSSITNGGATLTAGTDYTVVGNTVTISKSYLAQQSVGVTNLAFNFSAGAAQTLAVTVSDTTPQNSQLSQTTASFDKETSAQADVAVTLTLNGNTLSSITNGGATLTAGTDYTVVGNTVTISKAYLAQQSVGVTNLAFNFSAGAAQTLAVTVSDTTPQNSQLSQTTASFDKETSAQADVAVTLTLNGNTLSSITNGGATLTAGTDYTVVGNTVTISKSYLAQQSVGVTNLAFNFSAGAAQTLAVTVSDTTPQNSQLSQTTASFDKETSAQSDVAVTLTLNGNTLSSITNGGATLTAGTDYTVVGNTVTISKAYLAQQSVGVTNLAFNFSAGAAQTLAVTVSDTTPQNSQLSQTTASFDKETSAQSDVAVTLTLNGNTLSSITNGGATLTAGTDYTVVGNTVTISKAYLAQQSVGVTNLAFNFSAGAAQTLAVTVSDTTPQNSQLSQTTASFDKETSAQSDVAVTLTLNGNTLSSITNGGATLTAGTDYTVVGNTVTISKSYLAQQSVGVTNLAFNFSAGAAQTLAVTVSDTTAQNSQLSQTTASFDKETSAQADVAVTLTLNGNTLSSITNGGATLTAGTDYTVVGNVVTISKAYLAQQSVGTTNLSFNFSAGAAQTLAVTVSDTTAQNSQLSQTTASFDKEASAQADVAVTLTLNGNTLSSITNGGATLTAGTDYTVVGNTVTISKAYLTQQSVGVTNLAFNFSAGAAQTLAVTVSDTTAQNSQLSQTTASFDKEASAQADVAVTLTLNGNTLGGITNGMSALTPMVDYTVVGNVVTISKSYLAQQPVGTTNLSFNFSAGAAQTLAVSISDSTAPAAQDSSLSQTTASFDKETSAQADVAVTLTLNGNTLGGITNGMSALMPMVDYTIVGNVVTISKSYLAQQPVGTTNLSFNFSAGAAQTLAITISDTTPANYEAPVLQAINVDNAKANLQWNPVDGADGYNVYMALQSGGYNTEVTSVGQSVYSYEATGLTNGTTYYFVVKAVFASDLSDASNERSVTPITVANAPTAVSATAGNGQATVAFTAPTDNGGSAITGYEILDAEGHTVATGSDSPITVTGLTNGTSYSFTVKAINGAGSSVSSVSSNTVTPLAPTSSGETTQPGSSSSSASGASGTGVDIWINGRLERIGSAATSNVNGSTTTTITVDQALLEQKLAAEGQGAVITIPLLGNSSNIVIGELTGQMIKNMEQKQAVLELKTDRATYTVPAQQINVDAISKQLGQAVSLNDITLRIEIGTLTDNMMKIVQGSADKGGFTLSAPSLDFSVSAVYNNQILPITKFSVYVERTVALPAGIDPNQITTGIVVEPDGTVRHVPTKVVEDKGQYFVQINSLTNSAYSIVWHPLEFKDVANHWAKASVNNMGSRLVINGTGNELFSPNKDITRAEFAAIIVRGLGLKLENSAASFTDVQSADWYGSAVQTASAYGLINGFEDGSFRPNDKITREQAMAIIAKAMKITGLKDTLPAVESGELLGRYKDAAKTSAWATAGIADVLQAEIVTGRSDTQLAPKANMTRAEVAVIIERLLKTSGLI